MNAAKRERKKRMRALRRSLPKEGSDAPILVSALIVCAAMTLVFGGVLGWFDAALTFAFPAYARLETTNLAVETVSLTVEPKQMRISVEHGKATTESSDDNSSVRKPRVLIYHTHITEAYLQTAESAYAESGKWRTRDKERNVSAIGEELCRLLTEEYGIAALHDTTDHEPPKLSTSYSRSLLTMQAYKEKYPSIEYFIDVHRDAYGKDATNAKDYAVLDGKACARIMFVVGTGEGATGGGFDDMPAFESNLAFAQDVTRRLGEKNEQFIRSVRVKTGRYNQHVSAHCLLVEVGHNANTLEQALSSVPYLAQMIAESIAAIECGAMQTIQTGVWTPAE